MTGLEESVVSISIHGSEPNSPPLGTGFVVHHDDDGTYVITCRHVVERGGGVLPVENIRVDGESVLRITTSDAVIDLAVLLVKRLAGRKACSVREPRRQEGRFSALGYQDHDYDEGGLAPRRGTLCLPVSVDRGGGARPHCSLPLTLDPGQFIGDRYSGAPIQDDDLGAVVGVFRGSAQDSPRAHGRSLSFLWDVAPDLAEKLSWAPPSCPGTALEATAKRNLHLMDLAELETTLKELHQHGQAPCAALFLVQSTQDEIGDDLCKQRTDKVLRELVECTTIRTIVGKISPGSHGDWRTALDFVAKDFGLGLGDYGAQTEKLVQTLVARLRYVIRQGQTVVFRFENWGALHAAEDALHEFVDAFWNPLVQSIHKLGPSQTRVACIGLLMSHQELVREPRAGVASAPMTSYQVLTLPKCTRTDVTLWVELKSGVPSDQWAPLVEAIMGQDSEQTLTGVWKNLYYEADRLRKR